MAPHFSTLAWKLLWTEEPGRLQSMGSLRVGHDSVTSLSLSCIGEGNGNPLQCSCLENPRDGGAWWAAVCGVAQSWARLKRLSSSSSFLVSASPPFLDQQLFESALWDSGKVMEAGVCSLQTRNGGPRKVSLPRSPTGSCVVSLVCTFLLLVLLKFF